MRWLIMTVLTLGHEAAAIAVPQTFEHSASVFGSTIMESHWPNAPQHSATTIRSVAEADVTIRDEPLSDATILAWGRDLPRSQGVEDMMDLDI